MVEPFGVELVVPRTRVPYDEALELQRHWVEERRAARRMDTLLLLEHPPVLTLGRNADPAGVLAPPPRLETLGIPVHRVERGGQATYHGPGQLVGYPILSLRDLGVGIRAYVERLEEVMIRTAAAFGVAATRRPGAPGVYSTAGKLGALGVAVRRGITFHGFAFNVCPDLGHFELIVPCGKVDVPPVSLDAILRPGPSMDEVRRVVIASFEEVFGCRLAPRTPVLDHAPRA